MLDCVAALVLAAHFVPERLRENHGQSGPGCQILTLADGKAPGRRTLRYVWSGRLLAGWAASAARGRRVCLPRVDAPLSRATRVQSGVLPVMPAHRSAQIAS